VYGTLYSVFKKAHQVGLGRILRRLKGRPLKAYVGPSSGVGVCDLAHKTLKGQAADEKFGALLIATDFAKSNRTRVEP
jgi:hypothetical protein